MALPKIYNRFWFLQQTFHKIFRIFTNGCCKMYIFLTFNITFVLLACLIIFNLLNICNVCYAEENPYGSPSRNDPSLTTPYPYPNPLSGLVKEENPLLKGVYSCYSQKLWESEKAMQHLELILHNNRPDPTEVFLLRRENLRLNLLEQDMVDKLSYRDSLSVLQLWNDCVFGRLKVNSEEARSLLCYLSMVEEGYIYVPGLTSRPVLYDDLHQHISRFFPSPSGPQASRYYTNLEGSPNSFYINTNEIVYNLWLASKKNPMLTQALVLLNQNTALYTHNLLHPNIVVSSLANKEMYLSLLQSFLEKNFN